MGQTRMSSASSAYTISGSNTLHAVIYASRFVPLRFESQADCVRAILNASLPNNHACNVTGALLSCDGWFLQALEGRRLDVEQTLRRIDQDPNHRDVRRIHAGPIANRAFSQWSMCASTFSATDSQIVSVLSKSGRFTPATLDTTAALRLLLSVARLQSPAATPQPRP